MRFDIVQFSKSFGRFFLPFSYCLLLLIFMLIPLRIPAFASVKPFFPFVPIYHYAVFLPQDKFSFGFVFLTGFFADLLFALPFGVMTFTSLLYYLVISSQRKFFYGKPFVVIYGGFIALTFAATLFEWLFVSILQATFVRFLMPFTAFLLLVSLYFPFSLPAAAIVRFLKKEGGVQK